MRRNFSGSIVVRSPPHPLRTGIETCAILEGFSDPDFCCNQLFSRSKGLAKFCTVPGKPEGVRISTKKCAFDAIQGSLPHGFEIF